jgi:predicted Zn-dependent protease
VTISREGKQQTIYLNGKFGCDLNGFLRPSRDINASNTGTNIFANTGLFEAISNDNEVAFVLAHEAAHSILEHVAPKNEEGSKEFAIRRTMEIEADRLGVQLMANAGYDPYAAARFYARWKKKGRGLLEQLTGETFIRRYVKPKDRIAFLQKRAEEVDPDRKLATQAGKEE